MAKGRGEDMAPLIAKGESLTAVLGQAEAALSAVQEELEQWQLGLPNLLHESRAGRARRERQRGTAPLG